MINYMQSNQTNAIQTLTNKDYNTLTCTIKDNSVQDNVSYLLNLKSQFKINSSDLLYKYFMYLFYNDKYYITPKTVEFMEQFINSNEYNEIELIQYFVLFLKIIFDYVNYNKYLNVSSNDYSSYFYELFYLD